MKKKRISLSSILLVAAFLVGLSLLLYPTVSDFWNSFHSSRAVAAYDAEVSSMNKDQYEALWNAAVEYNRNLAAKTNTFSLTEEEEATYESLLDINDTGIMGYIEIPSINVSLPIYHGTADSVLQIAVGHINWSSLPTGGESTHTVLSGHRGLPSAKLFTNLDKLREGDTFVLRVLNENLTYEIDQILIVEPNDVEALQIVPGKDLCTLVTCTPYGINSHRLLVRGHHVENEEEGARVTADAIRIEAIIVAPIVALPILLILLIILLTYKPRKRK